MRLLVAILCVLIEKGTGHLLARELSEPRRPMVTWPRERSPLEGEPADVAAIVRR
jgi:hypothetical protein